VPKLFSERMDVAVVPPTVPEPPEVDPPEPFPPPLSLVDALREGVS
jgi:hypothetical protein